MKLKYSSVTLEDILKYSKAGGHDGVDPITDYVLSDEEHTYAEFLHDIDCELVGYGITENKVVNKSKLNIKNVKDVNFVKGYIQATINNIVEDYFKRFNINQDSLKAGVIEFERENCSALSIFTIQHLLRLNGYEINSREGITTKQLNFSMNQPVSYSIKIRKIANPIDEKRIKRRLDENNVQGASHIKTYIDKLQTNTR